MSSTNKTTNYELSQFVETDRPAWLTDYNGDMRTIDSTMKAISDVASGASGSISELADRMSTAEGNISTNTNDIATLDARADALEAGAQSTAGTIANIQTEQTAQNLGIEAATELGYNLARPYDSASTYAVGAYVLFQNTLYKCVTAIATGEAFDPTKWLAIKATDEIAVGGQNVEKTNIAYIQTTGNSNNSGHRILVDQVFYHNNNLAIAIRNSIENGAELIEGDNYKIVDSISTLVSPRSIPSDNALTSRNENNFNFYHETYWRMGKLCNINFYHLTAKTALVKNTLYEVVEISDIILPAAPTIAVAIAMSRNGRVINKSGVAVLDRDTKKLTVEFNDDISISDTIAFNITYIVSRDAEINIFD